MGIETIEHNGEKIYLRKDFFGWRTVEPLRSPETKKIIWKNFFNKKGFLTLGMLLIILGSIYFAYHEQLNNYKKVMDNPCAYCKDCQDYVRNFQGNSVLSKSQYNFSKLNLSLGGEGE